MRSPWRGSKWSRWSRLRRRFPEWWWAEVLEVARHPNADRLSLCQVDVGEPAPLAIVCGAPNVAAGMRVPCALVGARLTGADGKVFEIKRSSLRGVDSQGMLCSAQELGIDDDHSGLLPLAADAPIGARRARTARTRRHRVHPQAHAEPRRLPEPARRRARSGGDHRRRIQGARDRAGRRDKRRAIPGEDFGCRTAAAALPAA